MLFTGAACIKVADLGFSTRLKNRSDLLDTFCGSPPYAAPELFRDDNYVGPAVDIWAMGVLLFFMVTGSMPFRAETVSKLRRCILEGEYSLPTWVSAPCQRLIRGILRQDPAERCALDQMLGCEWLLPVEMCRPRAPLDLNPMTLVEADPDDLLEEEEEAKARMEELGITMEHITNNQGKGSRSPFTGVYRILVHRAQRSRGDESLPVIRGVVKDPKRDSLRAYRSLRHTSKLCVVA